MGGFKDAMQPQQGGEPQSIGGAQGAEDSAKGDGFGEYGEEATPEEVKLVNDFLGVLAQVLYPQRGQVNPQVMNDLKGNFDARVTQMFAKVEPPLKLNDPKDAIAATGTVLLVMIDSQLGYQAKANAEQDQPPEPGEKTETGEGGGEEPGEAAEGETPAQEQVEDGPSYSAVLWEAGQQIVGILIDIAERAKIAKLTDDEVGYVWLRATDLYRYASPNLDQNAMKRAFAQMNAAADAGKLPGVKPQPQDETQGVAPGLPGGPAYQQQGA